MLIDHPLLGPRDANEFTYLGDASLIERPNWQDKDSLKKFDDYLHLRNNLEGPHKELWYHEQGDRSWLVVTRDTLSHKIIKVELAKDFALKKGRNK